MGEAFQHDALGLADQARNQRGGIGPAVLEEEGASSAIVAPLRIKVGEIDAAHAIDLILGPGLDFTSTGAGEEQRQIVPQQLGRLGIRLYAGAAESISPPRPAASTPTPAVRSMKRPPCARQDL